MNHQDIQNPDIEYHKTKLWPEEKLSIGIPSHLSGSLVIYIIILVVVSLFLRNNDTFSSKFKMLSDRFAILSVVLLIYMIYITVKYNAMIQENLVRKQSLEITKQTYEDTMTSLLDYYPESYFLINELYALTDDPEAKLRSTGIKYDPAKRASIEDIFSDKILSNIESFLVLKQYLVVNHVGWMLTFYYMLTAPTIQQYYEKNRYYYSDELYTLYSKIKEIQDKDVSEEKLKDEISKIRLK